MAEVSVGFDGSPSYLVCTNTDDYPSFFERIATHALKLIACDGAANRQQLKGFKPDLLIGDLDSYQATEQATPQAIEHLPDQNSSDCEKALNYLNDQQIVDAKVVVCGLGGGRYDQSLYHLKLLWQFRHCFASFNWYGRFDHCFIADKHCVISSEIGKRISFFAPWGKAAINLKGVAYPVSSYLLDMQQQCSLSNSFTANQCQLDVIAGSVLVCAAL